MFQSADRAGGEPKSRGFTLLELLAVIAILMVLAAMLLPALSSAKAKARSLRCLANLGSIGQAMALYAADNDNRYPAAFIYRGMTWDAGRELPESATAGYEHWSGRLIRDRLLANGSLLCPSIPGGGLPAANPAPEDLEPGQVSETPGARDLQAPRCAYTVNQALCPANHFAVGFQGAFRPCVFVRDSTVQSPDASILATEWTADWRMLIEKASAPVCRSYLPVHGFVGLGPALANNRFDTRQFGCPRPCWASMRRLTPAELASDPTPPAANRPRLDWVGRNHQRKGFIGSRSSNFVFADGHALNTTVFDTLQPFRWGREFYSLQPGDDLTD